MAIGVPSSYGLIVRQGSAVQASLMAEFKPDRARIEAHSDEFLFGLAVAQSGQEVGDVVERLEAAGFLPGQDFAVTSSYDGVLGGSKPAWLRVLPHGVFELEQ